MYDDRITRSRYWLWVGILVGFQVVVAIISAAFSAGNDFILIAGVLVIPGFVIIGGLRLHDRGHSGWWLLLYFIPVVNFGLLLYLGIAPTRVRQ